MATDFNRLASEWLRALRGARTQRAVSLHLGYRSNISYRWEAGKCYPSAAQTFGIVEQLGGDVRKSLAGYYRRVPPWAEDVEPRSVEAVARLLDDLKGSATLSELASSTGYSRFALGRWLSGQADPPLPTLLKLIDGTSQRLPDFIASFTNPELIPSLRSEWRLLTAARKAAYEQPWSHAILRALELQEYRMLDAHVPGWLAERLALPKAIEEESIELLLRCRQIRWSGTHYVVLTESMVDTGSDIERARELRAWWANAAVDRLRRDGRGILAYNISAVSRADLAALEQLQRAFYRRMVGVIAKSTPGECVVLYAGQLVDLTANRS